MVQLLRSSRQVLPALPCTNSHCKGVLERELTPCVSLPNTWLRKEECNICHARVWTKINLASPKASLVNVNKESFKCGRCQEQTGTLCVSKDRKHLVCPRCRIEENQ